MSEFMKTASKYSRPNQAIFFLARDYLQSWRYKNSKESQSFSPLPSFIFYCCPFPIFFSLTASKLPLGDVKSRWNMGDLAQIIDTVFINPVIHIWCFTAAVVAWASRLWIRKTRAIISAHTAFRQTHVFVFKCDTSRKTRLPFKKR